MAFDTPIFFGLVSRPGGVAANRYYLDGSSFNYTHWAPDRPNNTPYDLNNCVIFHSRTGLWDDYPCQYDCDSCSYWPSKGGICEAVAQNQ